MPRNENTGSNAVEDEGRPPLDLEGKGNVPRRYMQFGSSDGSLSHVLGFRTLSPSEGENELPFGTRRTSLGILPNEKGFDGWVLEVSIEGRRDPYPRVRYLRSRRGWGDEGKASNPEMRRNRGVVRRMRTTSSKVPARGWTKSRIVRSGTYSIERLDGKRSRRTRIHSKAFEERGEGWKVVPKLLLAGAVIGPLLDCIHTNVGLLEYDVAPLRVGSLKSSATVPVLLSLYYVVLGCLHLQLPRLFKEWERSPAMPSNASTITISLICLASMLETSSVLFARKASMPLTYAILATMGVGNWYAFDRRAWTFVLGALVSVAAPASEVILMKLLGLWHYPSGDIFLGGEPFPSWVFLCYFFYTPFVTQLSLYFAQQTSQGESKLR